MNYIQNKRDSAYNRDSIKVTDIIDPFGTIRFKVALTSCDKQYDCYGTIYQITVTNVSTPNPLIILTVPEDEKHPLTDYKKAVQIFDECVENYTRLVKAETRDMQDIEIYKTRIGYKLTCPKCCATCKHMKHENDGPVQRHGKDRLICDNPKCAEVFDFDVRHNYERDVHYKDHMMKPMLMKPFVEPLGVCNFYEPHDKAHMASI